MMSKNKITIHCVHQSNFANYMIKYMVAKKIESRIEGAVLSNYIMPYWNIEIPAIDVGDVSPIDIRMREHELNIDRIVYLSETGLIDRINLHGHLQRIENFPSPKVCRDLFKSQVGGIEFDCSYLVCPIRGGEVLDARHPGYTLIPIDFYANIFEKNSALQPVFMGQIENNIYCDALRKAFPSAIFLNSQGVMKDFETIRRAKNIILPISTFAWLAAWMSHADKIILPVFGLFNPDHLPDNDFLPLGDHRYEFFQFPVQAAVRVENYAEAHRDIKDRWFHVTHSQLIRPLDQ